MRSEQVRKMSVEARFLYWIEERESIREAKERGSPQPWTCNEVLGTYRFCNVRRMDDKVSQWLLNNWYLPYWNHPNMLVAASLARHYNLPAALEEMGFPFVWDPEVIKGRMRRRKARGENVFNGAYMVRGIGEVDKTEMVVSKVVQPLVDDPPRLSTASMEECVGALLPYWGFSHFMAGQVVADLRWAMSGTWEDKDVWAPVGPGSARGMNRLHNRPINTPLPQEKFLRELTDLIKACKPDLLSKITSRMEAMDWQNCLCEFDKMERAIWGEGRPKQIYRARGSV